MGIDLILWQVKTVVCEAKLTKVQRCAYLLIENPSLVDKVFGMCSGEQNIIETAAAAYRYISKDMPRQSCGFICLCLQGCSL